MENGGNPPEETDVGVMLGKMSDMEVVYLCSVRGIEVSDGKKAREMLREYLIHSGEEAPGACIAM